MWRRVLTVIGMMGFITLPVLAAESGNGSLIESRPVLSVQGSARLEAVPDEVRAQFGVLVEDRALKVAYELHTQAMNQVIASVKALGIDAKDIQSSAYNVTPVYEQNRESFQRSLKPIGYRVSHELTVKLHDTARVGELIDKVMENEHAIFNGLTFDTSRREDIQKEAKVLAGKDARENAELIAKGLGLTLGRVLRVDDAGGPVHPARAYRMDAMAASAPQIEAGTLEITSSLNVTFEVAGQ